MDSDDYFDGDTFDDAVCQELDAIEASLVSPRKSRAPQQKPRSPILPNDSSFYDLTLDLDDEDLAEIDQLVEDAYRAPARPGRSRTVQTTLFGAVLPKQPATKPRSRLERTHSTSRDSLSSQRAQKTKTWDHTAFAKSGAKQPKGKGKGRAFNQSGDEEEEGDPVEFVQFPAPFVSSKLLDNIRLVVLMQRSWPPPMKLKPDLLEAKHWIFPLNQQKRDYQYNIVKHCLFDNTIVSLPTGLGKTFVAGVVMLNFYRWFPEGKVIFVAPTKPLVAQQIDACHKSCGIPGSDAAELTGNVPKGLRERAWREKRVLYLTPQTLFNDLTNETCDARDIILLVIDEAHRATGNYAYNQVVRYLMAKNPYFRILALTATPGSNPDAVQALIDGLHINRIEIRDENSLDLRPYLHQKKIEQHIIQMSDDINLVKEPLAALMSTILKPLVSKGVWYGQADPVTMHPYTPQARMSSLERDKRWAFGPLSTLSSLARAMSYLIEGTPGMCHTLLQDLSSAQQGDGDQKRAAKAKKLRDDPQFQAVMKVLEAQKAHGFSIHPKMQRLKALIVQHFAEALDEDGKSSQDNTRVMVFVTYREAVDEIVEVLNLERPLIRASRFIGQGIDKQGRKGLAQKEQLEVINKFKDGEFNVLVATSIGEEGLDIGEVDLIVCYDAQKTPIRMLQRLGRTGRKRDGVVHVLLAEGREEFNFDKAKDTYKEVQKTIFRGESLDFYTDVERLLPGHIKPICVEKEMEIQEYVREDGSSTLVPRGTKRKRNDDVMRNIPEGTITGFVSVADLIVKGPKKRKVVKKDFDQAGEDDDEDRELESGLILPLVPPRRTQSEVTADKGKSKAKLQKSSLRKSNTSAPTKKPPRTKKQSEVPASPTFSHKGMDDSDDMDIEAGNIFAQSLVKSLTKPAKKPPKTKSAPRRTSSDLNAVNSERHLDFPSTTTAKKSSKNAIHASPEPWPTHSSGIDLDIDLHIDLDISDEDSGFLPIRSTPVGRKEKQYALSGSPQQVLASPRPPPKPQYMGVIELTDSESLYSLTLDLEDTPPIPPGNLIDDESAENSRSPNGKRHDMSWLVDDDDDEPDLDIVHSSPQITEFAHLPSTDVATHHTMKTPDKPPVYQSSNFTERNQFLLSPATWPNRATSPVKTPATFESPEPSMPVRAGVRLNANQPPSVDSPLLSISGPTRRRLYRRRSHDGSPTRNSPEQPTSNKKKHPRRPLLPRHINPLLDVAADHSGEDVSDGASEDYYEEDESESDRQFLQELSETEAPASYDQSLMYRQGLFTQAPLGDKAPMFANRPTRNGAFGHGFRLDPGRAHQVLSSPGVEQRTEDDEPNEYAIGSFVVDDEAEISYINPSSQL